MNVSRMNVRRIAHVNHLTCGLLTLLMMTTAVLAAEADVGVDHKRRGANQTSTVSEVSTSASLPFEVTIEQADFRLPHGLQSFVLARWKNKLVLLTGRWNGLHGFGGDGTENFEPNQSNTNIYVIDLKKKTTEYRSLDEATWLSTEEIDLLSVTNAQGLTEKNTLYLVGGYGYDQALEDFSTKDTLTALDIPQLIKFVEEGERFTMRVTSDPVLQVTGGHMVKADEKDAPVLLVFGQNFEGGYTPSANGVYTRQVRAFHIIDDGDALDVTPEVLPARDPAYRRRDLNVVPAFFRSSQRKVESGFIVLAGVFTESDGVWTVPVRINSDGWCFMTNPESDDTFTQAMSHYDCAHMSLYDKRSGDLYTVLFGGISYGYFEDGVYKTDDGFPFINQVTTVKMDEAFHFTQYVMKNEFPVIESTCSNAGNTLLFGAEAEFVPTTRTYDNGVLRLRSVSRPVEVGYIIGGIMSTLPNTNSQSDSAASPYIFKVSLVPNE